MNNSLKQFILSAAVGFISSAAYLLTSYELDKVVNYNVSNVIGLTVDHIVNFIVQQLVFIGHLRGSKKFIIKFFTANTITLCYSQILFVLVHKYVKKYHPKFYKNKWDNNVSIIRYFLGALVYPLAFILRKYYVFV